MLRLGAAQLGWFNVSDTRGCRVDDDGLKSAAAAAAAIRDVKFPPRPHASVMLILILVGPVPVNITAFMRSNQIKIKFIEQQKA